MREFCADQAKGITAWPFAEIEQAVEPTEQQYGALERLCYALQKAVDILNEACPTTTALTPTGRLEVMQKRVEAMIEAGSTLQPALEGFYGSLNNE